MPNPLITGFTETESRIIWAIDRTHRPVADVAAALGLTEEAVTLALGPLQRAHVATVYRLRDVLYVARK